MLYHEQSEDYRPLMWLGGHPIYANSLMVLAHIVAFVVSALCISFFGLEEVYHALALSPPEIWHEGQVWRLLSYIAFDPYFFAQRSLWFLWSMLLLYFFGREVEQFVGRKAYFKVYAALVLVPALLLCVAGLFIVPLAHLNCFETIFGMFVAFATIYPGAVPSMWLPLSSKAMVWILLAVFSLIDLAEHAFTALFMLWACSAVGYFSMRLLGAGHGSNPLANWLEDRRSQKLARQRNIQIVREKKTTESIDAILDKISKHGVGSLDARERAALEQARTNLLKRDQR